jgi:hypothetical protein
MKKIASFLLVVLIFSSCTEEVKFNEVAFQGLKNNTLWKAFDYKAVVATNGSLSLQATYLQENLTININSAKKGVYTFTPVSNPKATFTSIQQDFTNVFKTNKSTNYGVGDDIISGEGTLQITKNTGTTISGTFRLTLVNEDEESDLRKVDFTEGNFNNIPITKL